MSTRLISELEKKINEWITDNCEEDDWIDGFIHPSLEQQMASAAYSVFAASIDAQKYAEKQGS